MSGGIADRRARVRRLDGDGLSQRAIAEQLGISQTTVRRDLAATEPGASDAGTGAPPVEPGAAPVEPGAPGGGPGGEPGRLVLPGAHPEVVALARQAQTVAELSLDGWPSRSQTPYLASTVSHTIACLRQLPARQPLPDYLVALQLRRLADQLTTFADQLAPTVAS